MTESTVRKQLRALETHPITEADVRDALEGFDAVWQQLFPVEQARIVQLLVDGVEVRVDGLEMRLRADGLRSLIAELTPEREEVSSS